MFSASKKFPLFVRLIRPLNDFLVARIIEKGKLTFRTLKIVSSLEIPGYSFESKLASIAIIYNWTFTCFKKFDVSLVELRDLLVESTHLAKSLTENELLLLETLPNDEDMARLPEKLQEQFDKANQDEEFFFSGEEYKTFYALGKAIRMLKDKRSRTNVEADTELVLLETLLSHPGRFLILRTSRKIDEFRPLQLAKKSQFVVDPEGDEIQYREMRDLSELAKIQVSNFALLKIFPPLFYRKLLRKEFLVREYGFIEELRQEAIILIDRSPSTLFKGRLFKAGGILFNRALCALRDDAIVHYILFDEEEVKTWKYGFVDSPHEAQMAVRVIKMENFVGSGTGVDNALKFALSKFKTRQTKPTATDSPTPHIMLVTDGDVEITVTPNDCCGIKVHSFLLGESNPTLQKISEATGGVYYEYL